LLSNQPLSIGDVFRNNILCTLNPRIQGCMSHWCSPSPLFRYQKNIINIIMMICF